MFRLNQPQLDALRLGSLALAPEFKASSFDDPKVGEALASLSAALREMHAQSNSLSQRMSQVLTSCGPMERDTDGGTVHFVGESDDNASPEHAIVEITQLNPDAGSALNVNGQSNFNGTSVFSGQVSGVIRTATATANWVNVANPGVPTVAATDDETGATLSVLLYRTGDGDPNVRSGYTIAYTIDAAGNAVSLNHEIDGTVGKSIQPWFSETPKAGWQIVDGSGTMILDLQGKFIMGYDGTTAFGGGGGTATHSHFVDEVAFANPDPVPALESAARIAVTDVQNHIPPFVALNWIMRVD